MNPSPGDDLGSMPTFLRGLPRVAPPPRAEDLPWVPPRPGERLAGYEIAETLARGGQGVVYRARDEELRRDVALKLSLAAIGPEAEDAFRTEANAHAGLTHPHIAPVYSFGRRDDGRPYFVMELAACTLADVIAGNRPPAFTTPREAAAVVFQLAEALAYAHGRGVFHRDLKPSNVLLAEDGTAKLTDFGLAGAGRTSGTAAYMAPEVAAARLAAYGPVSAGVETTVAARVTVADGVNAPSGVAAYTTAQLERIDVYGLGAILHQTLTGSPPHAGKDEVAILEAAADPSVPPPLARPDCPMRVPVPVSLRAIALKCLAHHPEDRYESVRAVADDLEQWLGSRLTRAYPTSPPARLVWWAGLFCRRLPAAAALLLTMAILAVGGPVLAGWFYALAEERDTQQGIAQDNAEKEKAERLRAEAAEKSSRSRSAQLAFEKGRSLAAAAKPGEGVPWMVRALELSPDDDPNRDSFLRSLRQWHFRTPRLHAFIPQEKTPYGLAFSGDGKRLYASGQDGILRGYDADTGKPLGMPVRLTKSCERLLIGKDGKTLYAPGTDGRLHRFAALGDELRLLDPWPDVHTDSILAIALTPDGKHLATGGRDGRLVVRETATGKVVRSSFPHSTQEREDGPVTHHAIRDAAFFDNDRIGTAGWDKLVRVYDWRNVDDSEKLLFLDGNLPWAVCFVPVGNRVFTATADFAGNVSLWHQDGKREPLGLKGNGPVSRLVPRPGPFASNVLVTGYGDAARVFDSRSRSVTDEYSHPMPVEGAAWAPDGMSFATASADGLRVWHLPATGTTDPLAFDDAVRLDMTNQCLSGGRRRVAVVELAAKGRVWAWDIVPDGVKPLPPVTPAGVGLLCSCFDPSGGRLLLGGVDGTVSLRDLQQKDRSWATKKPRANGPGPVRAVAFSPDGSLFAAGHLGGRVAVGRAADGVIVRETTISGVDPFALDFGRDGKRLVVVAKQGQSGLLAWIDTETGLEVGPRVSLTNVPTALDVSPDGAAVAVASLDRRIPVFGMNDHQPIGPEIRTATNLRRVRFTPDGRGLLAIGADDAISLFDRETARPLGKSFSAGSNLVDAVFDNSGDLVLYAPGRVDRLPMPTTALTDLAAARRAVRLATAYRVDEADRLVPLTAAEWNAEKDAR